MDALVRAALDRVNEAVTKLDERFLSGSQKEEAIAKAIHAVDALKSALKTL